MTRVALAAISIDWSGMATGGAPVDLSVAITLQSVRGMLQLTDGRHRVAMAQRMGRTELTAHVRELGPRGGVRREYAVVVVL